MNAPRRILGIDPGLRVTGFGVVDLVPGGLVYIASGVVRTGTGGMPLRLGVIVRDLAVLVLMGLVVRDVLNPDEDVVRTTWPGVDDPAGGPLDNAGDVVALGGRGPFRLRRVGPGGSREE